MGRRLRRSQTCIPTGEDIHSDNAIELYGRLPNVRALHVNGLSFRDNAKKWVHASDYAGGARTISQAISLSEDKVKRACIGGQRSVTPRSANGTSGSNGILTRAARPWSGTRSASAGCMPTQRPQHPQPSPRVDLSITVAVVINKGMLALSIAPEI
jgi:hypothetical protein